MCYTLRVARVRSPAESALKKLEKKFKKVLTRLLPCAILKMSRGDGRVIPWGQSYLINCSKLTTIKNKKYKKTS